MMNVSKEVAARQAIERRIAVAVVEAALRAGYLVSVDNGEDETQPSTDKAAILKAMFLTDEERLYVYRPPVEMSRPAGWVFFVYGNDGWDVINDYTDNLEPLMEEADRLSLYYQEKADNA